MCLSDRRFSCRSDTPKRPFKISQTNNSSNLSAYFKSKVGAMGLTVREILRAAGCDDVVPLQVRRLGKRNEDESRNRPLLVVTDSFETRRKILEKKSTLKTLADDCYKTIYIKPDEPLAIRKEWKRLKDSLKKEKKAPTNQGVEVKLDYKTRQLLRAGTVIDKFKSPFHKRGPSH